MYSLQHIREQRKRSLGHAKAPLNSKEFTSQCPASIFLNDAYGPHLVIPWAV